METSFNSNEHMEYGFDRPKKQEKIGFRLMAQNQMGFDDMY